MMLSLDYLGIILNLYFSITVSSALTDITIADVRLSG